MKKTVVEMFAGCGGFRVGLNHITENVEYTKSLNKDEKYETVWFSQWEPSEKKTQYAHDCYVYHFGTCLDLDGKDTTNIDIDEVDKTKIPDHTLLVFGFPCQNYSVASTLKSSKGIEGEKGQLWWSIRDTFEAKMPPFAIGENVDRLLKSPAKQRGRDFGIILACLRDLGYTVEWRVINAAEYGLQQRRRRTFFFAYRNDTKYAKQILEKVKYNNVFGDELHRSSISTILKQEGIFAKAFPIKDFESKKIQMVKLPQGIGELADSFAFEFENCGIMLDGIVYTVKSTPDYDGKQITLGDIMDSGKVAEEYFIDENRLYYSSNHNLDHTDETKLKMSKEERQTWQYIKGAKKMFRTASNGHQYVYSEGAIPMIDSADKPARTMLTSEGSFSRTTHIVQDKQTGKIRLLTAEECERIQGFPTGHTKYCMVNGKIVEMPTNKRRFMMGNALVCNIISNLEKYLTPIIENE